MIAFALLSALIAADDPAPAPFALETARRVLFLGDSNTFAGGYVRDIEGYLATRLPDREYEIINLGLPSETVTGLTEPGHPFPRPDVHERLERALDRIRPEVVVACYGMNDGIYAPFSRQRFAKYQDGILKLVSRCRDRGISVYLVTPPPFDPSPLKGKVRPEGAAEYGWMAPYENYQTDVLARYGEWLKTFSGVGFSTIDAGSPLERFLKETRARKGSADYLFAGDGVHLNADGHFLMALEILKAWHAPEDVGSGEIDAKAMKAREGEIEEIRRESGGIRFKMTVRVPMPVDPGLSPEVAKLAHSAAGLNRLDLVVSGLDDGRYRLYEGSSALGIAESRGGRLAVDLAAESGLSTRRRAAEIGRLVERRSELLGRAWLSSVGHKRPDTPEGTPLDRAKTEAAGIAEEIRRLARPVVLELRIVRGGD